MAADHDLKILGNFALEAQTFLPFIKRVEPIFVVPLIDIVPVEKPVALHTCFDPIAFEEIKAFDIVLVIGIEELMRVFGGLDRHAITRQHVEMGGPRKCLYRGFDGV